MTIANSQGQNPAPAETRTAVFAGGCFWDIQPASDKAKSVIKTVVGYCGGSQTKPDLRTCFFGKNRLPRIDPNHLRSGENFYDQLPRDLLAANRPTQADGQFTDIGPSYRAAICSATTTQRVAETSKEKLAHSGKFKKPIVTEILPAMKFYPAEAYHQKYYQQNPEHFEAFEQGSGRVLFKKKAWDQ